MFDVTGNTICYDVLVRGIAYLMLDMLDNAGKPTYLSVCLATQRMSAKRSEQGDASRADAVRAELDGHLAARE